MSKQTTRRRMLQAAGGGALASTAGCLTSITGGEIPEGLATIRVRIENVAPTNFYPSDASTGGGLWLSPGAYLIQKGHEESMPDSEPASVGLEALAEAGRPNGFEGQQGLVEEMETTEGSVSWGTFGADETVADPNDPAGEVPGAPAIAPGGAFEFDIEILHGQFFSVALMLIPSNDVFIAPKNGKWIRPWPWSGEPPLDTDITHYFDLWDAGTEPNGQPGFGSDQPPSQESPTQGGDEEGVVRQLSKVDDGHDYPAVDEIMKLTVTPVQ